MKTRIKIKDIRSSYDRVFSCSYCALQELFTGLNPAYYNAGAYGWNFDLYEFEHNGESIAITTGYRSMVGKNIGYELTSKYDNAAREIKKRLSMWSEEAQAEFENLRTELFNEIIG